MSTSVLKDIFDDTESRSYVASMLTTDNALRYQLFKLDHPYLPLFISLLWSYWSMILALWLLLELAFWFEKARKGIQIDNFSYDTQFLDPGKKEGYDGLSALLSVRLNRLSRLYQKMDESHPISSIAEITQPIPAAIKAEDASDLDSKVFTDSSSLSIWGLAISGSFINSLIGWAIRRPKINGSLYREAHKEVNKEGGKFVLTSRYSTNGRYLSWRVERDVPPDLTIPGTQKQSKSVIDEMVSDLAYMVFSDLAFGEGREVPWEAVKHFTEGLRSYRECVHGTSDRRPKLLESINSFEKCLSEDEDFPWAHYNLGVAYYGMGKTEPAKASLEKAIALNSNYWQPYYALAMNLFETRDDDKDKAVQICDEAIWLCKKALSLKPDCTGRAKIYDLIALVCRKKCEYKQYEPIEPELFKPIKLWLSKPFKLELFSPIELPKTLIKKKRYVLIKLEIPALSEIIIPLEIKQKIVERVKCTPNELINSQSIGLEISKGIREEISGIINKEISKPISLKLSKPMELSETPIRHKIYELIKLEIPKPSEIIIPDSIKQEIVKLIEREKPEPGELINSLSVRPELFKDLEQKISEANELEISEPFEIDIIDNSKLNQYIERKNSENKETSKHNKLEISVQIEPETFLFKCDEYNCMEECLMKATAYSLRGLRRSILMSKSIEAETEVVDRCFEDLSRYFTDKDDRDNAELLLDKALELSPANRSLHLALAEVCLDKEETEKALKNVSQGADPSSSRYQACLIETSKDIASLPQSQKDVCLPCLPGLDEVALYSVLNRFSIASSDEIKRLRDSLASLHTEYFNPLNDLHRIKRYYEGLKGTEIWSNDLEDWAKAEDALKAKRKEEVLPSIEKLEKYREKAKNIGHKDVCEELKYSVILRTLGSLYHFCYMERVDVPARRSNEVLKSIAVEVPDNYRDLREYLLICSALDECDLREVKDAILYKKDMPAEDKNNLIKIFNKAILYDSRKEVYDIFILITDEVMKKCKGIDNLPDEYEAFKECLLDDWNLSPLDKLDKARIEKLIKKSPLNAIHRKNLGRYYYKVNNYLQAREEFERALLLNPDDPRTIYNIGLSYLQEAESDLITDNPEKRLRLKGENQADCLKKAKDKLLTASKLFDNDIYKIKAYYYLGYINYLNNNYKEAILYLKTAKSISKDNGFDIDEGLLISMMLADIYLDISNYDKCEDEFGELISLLPKNSYNNDIGEQLLGKSIKCGFIAAQARLELAFSYMERDINLDDAAVEINNAYDIIEYTNIKCESQLMAQYWDCVGWFEYKRYLANLSDREFDQTKYKHVKDLKLESVAMVSELTFTDAIITSATNDSNNVIIQKTGSITLKNVIMSNVNALKIVVRTSIGTKKITNIPISKIYVAEASINGKAIINYDRIDANRIIKSNFYCCCPNKAKLDDLKEIKGIERAYVINATLSDLKLDEEATISKEIPQSLLDSAISHLKQSIKLYADPQSYLHLGAVYETMMQKEKDPNKKAFFKEMATTAFKHALELDHYHAYAEELTALKEQLGKKDEVKKEKKKEGTSILLDIQGTAKGEMVPPKSKDKKE